MKTRRIKFLLILVLTALVVESCETNKKSNDLSQNNDDHYKTYIGEMLLSNASQDYYKLFEKDFNYSKYRLLNKNEITKILEGKKFNDNKLTREIGQMSEVYGLLFKEAKTTDLGDITKDNYEVLYVKIGRAGSNAFVRGVFLVIDDFGYQCPHGIQCERCVGCKGPYKTCFWVCMSESGGNCSSC